MGTSARRSAADKVLEGVIEHLNRFVTSLRQAATLDSALEMTVRAARSLLECDRTLVYQILSNGDGVVIAESVGGPWRPVQGQLIYDPCFQNQWHQPYQQGHISHIEDVGTASLDSCHIELLTRLQVRANLVVPILLQAQDDPGIRDPHLWGLLIAHQCRNARAWQPAEIQALQNMALQLGLTLPQIDCPPPPPPPVVDPPSPKSLPQPRQAAPQPSERASAIQPAQPTQPAQADSPSPFSLFDALQTPVWIFDIANLKLHWANQAALPLWSAASREELCNRDFSDASEATRIRLQDYLRQFRQGRSVTEQWTFYPNGMPALVNCRCSGIEISPGHLAMLVEGSFAPADTVDPNATRLVEALRHTDLMVSLYTLAGLPILQNPAASKCYGDTWQAWPANSNAFLRRFVNPQAGQQAMAALETHQSFSVETEVFTLQGVRWHSVDGRQATDPVTGHPMLLIYEKDITARKQNEATLAAQQSFLRQIIDTVPSAVFVKDREGYLQVVNQACSDIHGTTVEAMIGRREPDFNANFDEHQLAQFLANNEEVMATRQAQRKVQQIVTAQGELRWYQTVIRPWIDDQSEVRGIVGNTVDITELKQAEAALQEESYRLATILATQQEIISSHTNLQDVMTLIVHRTQALTQASGAVIETVEGDELVYHSASGIAAEHVGLRLNLANSLSGHCLNTGHILQCDDVENHQNVNVEACRRIGLRSMLIAPLLHQGVRIGVLKVVSTAVSAFNEQHLQTLQLMAGFLSAALQLASEFEAKGDLLQALQQSENRYRSVVDVLTEGIVLHQADGQITACNASAEAILGLTAEQMMGHTPVDPRWQTVYEDGTPFPGELHPAAVTLRTGQPLSNVIMGVHKPDGSLSWISINSQPLIQPGKSLPYATVASFVDITAARRTEALLHQQTERDRTLYTISQAIRQSLELQQVLETAVAEVRTCLAADRVIIYRFNPNWSGVVVAESVTEGCRAILNQTITDTYFVEHQEGAYSLGTVKATANIYTAGLSPCHIEMLERFQVQAKLVVPIWQEGTLWGLLIAYQCNALRDWQPFECELMMQLADQIAIAIQQSELYQQLQAANQELALLSTTDSLTNIANRRQFDRYLRQACQRSLPGQNAISLIMCDVDYFKRYNDIYGHATGDACLTAVAQAIQQAVQRPNDLVTRYGGEEFAIILPNTHRAGAAYLAYRIRRNLEQLKLPHEGSMVSTYVTLSLGIATAYSDITPAELIEQADQALYRAKEQGRNSYCFQQIGEPSPTAS